MKNKHFLVGILWAGMTVTGAAMADDLKPAIVAAEKQLEKDAWSMAVAMDRARTPAAVVAVTKGEAFLDARIEELGARDPAWGAASQPAFNDLRRAREGMRAWCRSDEGCLKAWAEANQAAAVCTQIGGFLDDIAVAQRAIALERSNPAGVIDLYELHVQGDIVTQRRAWINDVKRSYAEQTGKVWSPSLCVKPFYTGDRKSW